MFMSSNKVENHQQIMACIFYYILYGIGAFLVIPSFFQPLGVRIFLGNTSGNIPFGNSSYQVYIARGSTEQLLILILDILVVVGIVGLIVYLLVSRKPVRTLGQNMALPALAMVGSIVNVLYVLIFSNEILTFHSSIISQKTWDESLLQLSAVFALYVIGALVMLLSSTMLLIQIKYWRSVEKKPEIA